MLDEPVNGLDPEGILWIRNLLKELAAEGRTVFVSSASRRPGSTNAPDPPGIAFVGDLAFNGTHAYLAEGHTDAWLRALDRAEEAFAGIRTLYVGHGSPAVPAVLAEQRRYLLMVREFIARVPDGRPQLGEDEANRVASLMQRYLAGAPLGWLVGAGASAVAAELAGRPRPHDGDDAACAFERSMLADKCGEVVLEAGPRG